MYDVVLLIERELQALDADQAVSLHEGLEDTVRYHLLLPVESSASLMAASMSAVGGGQIVPITDPAVVEEVQDELISSGQAELDASVALFTARGQEVTGRLTEDDPIDALAALVTETGSTEAIILTEPHLVSELFRLDWASRAKRRLDIPTLHLLEHVPLDAQGDI